MMKEVWLLFPPVCQMSCPTWSVLSTRFWNSPQSPTVSLSRSWLLPVVSSCVARTMTPGNAALLLFLSLRLQSGVCLPQHWGCQHTQGQTSGESNQAALRWAASSGLPVGRRSVEKLSERSLTHFMSAPVFIQTNWKVFTWSCFHPSLSAVEWSTFTAVHVWDTCHAVLLCCSAASQRDRLHFLLHSIYLTAEVTLQIMFANKT